MTDKDRIISQLFQLVGYCQGIIFGMTCRLEQCDVDTTLFTDLQNEVRMKTDNISEQNSKIIDGE